VCVAAGAVVAARACNVAASMGSVVGARFAECLESHMLSEVVPRSYKQQP